MSIRFYGRKRGLSKHFEIRRFEAKPGILPESVSYESYAAPVYDQGAFGSCVANSTAAVQRLYHRKRTGQDILVSRAAVYSQAKYSYEPTDIADDGLLITDGLLVPKNFGYALESAFPYPTDPSGNDAGNLLEPVPPADWSASFKEATYLTVDAASVDSMIRALVAHGPLVIGLSFAQEFENIGSDGLMDPKYAQTDAGGHCVHILAYDQHKFGGSFRIRNSWGTSWGSAGDGWMPFSTWTIAPSFAPDEAYTVAFPET
jgi:C1A family cysteine protease